MFKDNIMTNLREITINAAKNYGSRKAFSYRLSKEEVKEKTYTEFQSDINALGTYFYKHNIKKSTVAIIGDNSYEWILAYFSIVEGENIAVPIDKNLPIDDVIYILSDSNCKGIIFSDEYTQYIKQIKEGLCEVEFFINMKDFGSYISEGNEDIKRGYMEFVHKEINSESTAMLVYTSGTTGKSKGVILSHKNLAVDAYSAGCNFHIEGDTILFLPLHHAFGLVAGVMMVLIVGRKIHINHNLRNIEEDFKLVKPKTIFLVPIIVEEFYKKIWRDLKKAGLEKKYRDLINYSNEQLNKDDNRREIFKSILDKFGGELKCICSGGGPLNEIYVKGYRDFGINLINGYGISECSPVVAVNKNDYYRDGSVGQVINCCEVKISNKNSQGIGTILVKGSNVMKGYYNNDLETKKVLSEDGWLNTGDLGRIDKDGFLFITGRSKNVIVLSNGENVQAEELENKIQKLNYVKEVLVYGENNMLVAEVFLEDTDAKDSLKEDIAAINGELPLYKRIKKIKIRDVEFEKTATKKIKRSF